MKGREKRRERERKVNVHSTVKGPNGKFRKFQVDLPTLLYAISKSNKEEERGNNNINKKCQNIYTR